MKFNLYAAGQYCYYMGRLYKVIWATATKVKLQLAGTFGMGMTAMNPHAFSLYNNQEVVSVKHWSLYRAPE